MIRTSHTQRGYSISEMLVVTAIVGILSLVVVPQFISMYRASTTKASMRDFTSTLRKARQVAVTRGERTRVWFNTGTTGGTSFEIDTGGTAISNPTWTLYPSSKHKLDSLMYFDASTTIATTTGSTKEIDFLPSGLACEPDDSSSTTDPPKALGIDTATGLYSERKVVLRSSYKDLAYNQYDIVITPSGGVTVTPFKWQ